MASVARSNLSALQQDLLVAGKAYSSAAKNLAAKAKAHGRLKGPERHRLVGIGIASDWTRRAAGLTSVSFAGRLMNRSDRAAGFTELLRFTFAWSGLNAIFARDELLELFGTTPDSEVRRFRLLYDASKPDPVTAATRLAALHGILAKPSALGADASSVTTLAALHSTYVPLSSASKGVSKTIGEAIATGSWTSLDIPLLVYALRNWALHGNTLDTSWRSKPGFRSYVATVSEALADVHVHTAKELARRLK